MGCYKMEAMFVISVLLLFGVATSNNNQPSVVHGCVVQDSHAIENCCNLGYRYSKFGFVFYKPNVYTIKNFCGNCQSVQKGYCDTNTAGGGWLVIQRRQDGSVDFNRDWVEYEDGFGSLTGEFWFGLRAIHCLTNQGQWELRIDYTLTNGTKGYLSYSNFRVGPATEQYPLTISGFDGVTTEPFYITPTHIHWSLNQMKFTTRDRDNDRWGAHCALDHVDKSGGWWYNHCSRIRLNHQYNNKYTIYLNGQWYALSFAEMKIRPKSCMIKL